MKIRPESSVKKKRKGVTQKFEGRISSKKQLAKVIDLDSEPNEDAGMRIEKIKAKLTQLKYMMESYLRTDAHDATINFSFCLRQYLEILGINNVDFARNISISPAELSLYLHSYRYPPINILVRLELHSNNIFPATMWLGLINKEAKQSFLLGRLLRSEGILENNIH